MAEPVPGIRIQIISDQHAHDCYMDSPNRVLYAKTAHMYKLLLNGCNSLGGHVMTFEERVKACCDLALSKYTNISEVPGHIIANE